MTVMKDYLSDPVVWACPWTVAGPAWIIKMGCGMGNKAGCICDRSLNNDLLPPVWRTREQAEVKWWREAAGESSLRAVPMPMAREGAC